MRAFRASFLLLVALGRASAADLKIKVIDPHSSAVASAQISLIVREKSASTAAVDGTYEGMAHKFPVRIAATSAEGIASFGGVAPASELRIKVLAPGFTSATYSGPFKDHITIQLHLAAASETVVVTATRTLALAEDTGASISTSRTARSKPCSPWRPDDAVRFLPGAVVNTAGQRGGLSSLFVRGGDSTYNKVIVDGVTVNEPGGTFDFGTLPLTEANRVEFLRGAQSTLYGTDAMTSVVQVFTRAGSTRIPEIRFGADGGNFSTANGYASLAGARGRSRLQPFRRSVQYQRIRHQRRLFRFAARCKPGRSSERQHFATVSPSPLQQSHWNSRRIEFQWLRSLVPINGLSQPLAALPPIPTNGRNTTM